MAEEVEKPADVEVPPESALLRAAYKKSGLTVADLAAASGLSVATLHIAFTGIRYRNGVGKAAIPPDQTLVKVGSVLRLDPAALRAVGRERAAGLLEEARSADDAPVARSSADLDAVAAVAGRMALAKQIFSLFSTDELRAEIERRDRADDEREDARTRKELADDLRAEQHPG